jgi:hypothetical protein
MNDWSVNYKTDIHASAIRTDCDASVPCTLSGNVSLRPHLSGLPRNVKNAGFEGTFEEITMVGKVAFWGSNILLVGMALATYALLFLAK